jgi:YesN/AraC family two-component response regulator
MESGEEIAEELGQWIDLLQTVPSEIENTIEELESFIRQHYRENLNLSELADKYHFNHSYLTKTFKKQKGISPLRLINTLRIDDAKELLQNEELSVREISEMLGFSNQHYFSRMFKDMTGQTPKEYRQSSSSLQ